MDQHTPEPQKNNTLATGVVVFAVIALLSVGAVAIQKKSLGSAAVPSPAITSMESSVSEATPSPAEVTEVIASPTAATGEFKDGTYSVVGNYISPGGEEEIAVKVTLADNIIKDIDVESKAFRPMSQNFQGKFISGYKPLVLGKKISEVKLDKVSGSSLTPKGFNDALQKVMKEPQT
jgi:uncharacterized protein with FMN-binding domain